LEGEVEVVKVIFPTWLAHVFEEKLQVILHKYGCVRLVEELGELSGVEVVEWLSPEGGGRTGSLSLSIRQHDDASSLVEISCTSRRLRDLVLLAGLKLVAECASSIRHLDNRINEPLSKVLAEIERMTSLIEEGLSAQM